MKAVRFHEAAQQELADTALYYAAISPKLGEIFVAAVEAATLLASEYPSIGSPYKYSARRMFPKKFRFSVAAAASTTASATASATVAATVAATLAATVAATLAATVAATVAATTSAIPPPTPPGAISAWWPMRCPRAHR